MNKNEYFDMIEKTDKLYSEYKTLKNKINNPFEEKWQNEIFKLLKNYNHITICKVLSEEDGNIILKRKIKRIFPSNNDIILEFDDLKFKIPKKWGEPKLSSFFEYISITFKNNIEISIDTCPYDD